MANSTVIDPIQGIRRDDIIIVFMGPTGVGKSYFINLLTNQMGGQSNYSFTSISADIQATRVKHPKTGAANIVLVDTPGFDDTTRTDFEILIIISDWLEKTYRRDVKLSGLIYLHRITDNRMAGAPYKNLRMFGSIWGDDATSRVVLVTTMWGRLIQPEVGDQRERELKEGHWRPLIEKGAGVERLVRSEGREAWRIVDYVIKRHKERVPLLLQEELVSLQRRLNETTVGQMLYQSLQILLVDQKISLRSLLTQIEKATDPKLKEELERECTKIVVQSEKTSDEVNKMKVPFSRRLQTFFFKSPVVSEVVLDKPHKLKDSNKKRRDSVKAELEETESENEIERELQERRRMGDEIKRLAEEREKAKEMEREKEREREELRENERQERRRREDEISASVLILRLVALRAGRSSLAKLQDADAQSIVDFIDKVLDDQNVFTSDERKQAIRLLSRLAKSAQVFPRCLELTGVECDIDKAPLIQGGHGGIYRGRFGSQAICVKAVRVTINQGMKLKDQKAQAGELVFWAHLSHPNVLPFYGVYFSDEEIPRTCLVSPWMEHGHLVQYLAKNPKSPRVPLLVDIISGLRYLHEAGIIHSDLKAANVLVSSAERAMLTDFGISRISTTTGVTLTDAATGTTHWMAPELFTEEGDPPPTFASDMWSFGCTCYEAMTGKVPFHKHKPEKLISTFIKTKGQYTPLRADPVKGKDEHEGAQEIWVVTEQCWDSDPGGRPTAEEVWKSLTDLRVKDKRPSPDADSDGFLRVKRDREKWVEIDYNRVHTILRQVHEECAKNQGETGNS